MLKVFASRFDDADMWMSRPDGWTPRGCQAPELAVTLSKTNISFQRQGRNVHMLVFNMAETVVSIPFPLTGLPWRSVSLITCAVPMIAAN